MLAATRSFPAPVFHAFAGLALALSALSLLAQQGALFNAGLRLRMSDQLLSEGSAQAPASALRRPVLEAGEDAPGGDRFRFGPGIRLRGVTLTLTSAVRHDDNVLRRRYNEEASASLVLEPGIALDGGVGRHPFRFAYLNDTQRYFSLKSENTTGHEFLGEWRWNASRRFRMTFDAGLEFGSDRRGDLESRIVNLRDPDRWRAHRYGIEAVLGRRIAKAEVGASYDLTGIRYLNNQQGIRDLDRRTVRLFGRYNLGPRFSLLSEIGGQWTRYLDPRSTLGTKEFNVLGGVAWQATAKTSGEILVGQRHTHFYDGLLPSGSGSTWRANVVWAPRTFSKFTAYTSREIVFDAFGGQLGSSAARTDTYGLRWRHGISERLAFATSVERIKAAFTSGVDDRYLALGGGVRYEANRFFTLFARWEYTSRSSATHLTDYESHSVFFGFDARFDRSFNR